MGKGKGDHRILTICSMIGEAKRVVEIGADHGLISLTLAQRKDIDEILSTDISPASLSKLKDLLNKPRLKGSEAGRKIRLHVGDGLKDLPWDWADVLILTGMGGNLILSILEGNFSLAQKASQWILGPQSDLSPVRTFLIEKGLGVQERMAEEGGKYYPLLDVRPDEPMKDFYREALSSPFMMEYGPDLLRKRDPILLRLLHRDQEKIEQILKALNSKNRSALMRREDLALWNQEIQTYLEGAHPKEGH